MPFTNNGSVRLHWDEQGEGTTVLLVMGHRFSSAMWYPVIPALAEHHRVVWFDNRGTGASDGPPRATFEDLVDDTLAVADAAGIESAHVYGVSMGGGIAQAFAMAHPERVRSLVLGCTGVFSIEKFPRGKSLIWVRRALSFLPASLAAGAAKKALYGTSTPPEAAAHDIEMLKKDPISRRGVLAQAMAIQGYATTREAVATIDVPALVLHGTADTTVKYSWGEELADALGARLVPFEGAGHNYLVADPAKANGEVLAFLAEVDAG